MVGGRRDRRKTQSDDDTSPHHRFARCAVHSGSDTAVRVTLRTIPTMKNSPTTPVLPRAQANAATFPVGLRCRAAVTPVRAGRGRNMGRRSSTALPANSGRSVWWGEATDEPAREDARPTSASLRFRSVLGFLLLCAVCLLALSARAQVVSDTTTNTLNNVTNIVAGNVVIGTNGSFTLLTITNGAVLTNSGSGFTGLNAGANSNRLVVTGTNSAWRVGLDLMIGLSGSGNQLIISNGGVVTVGQQVGVSSFLGRNVSSSNNLAIVTGAGSLWSNSGELRVGNDGAGNRMIVSNGGTVINTTGFIGVNATSTNNLAVVTGTNSVWNNSADLIVGFLSSGNQLVVSNGGTVRAANVIAGVNAGALDNRITVDGGSLFATNGAGTGTLDIRRGTTVLNAGLIQTDNLLLTNNAGFFEFNGGTLVTRGGTVGNGQVFVVGADLFSDTAAILDVRSGAPLVLGSALTLGDNFVAPGNQLLITNGGSLRVTGSSFVGNNFDSSNNLALVSGANSRWTNTAVLYVGRFGSGNQLVVSNGATVRNSTGYLGFDAGANGNVALVTGAGSLWTNSNDLSVGESGSGNQLVVSNGGTVRNTTGYLGNTSNANNNVAVVTGTGSLWNNSSWFHVGNVGSGNQLIISNGGVVTVGEQVGVSSFLGRNVSSSNNLAVVTGSGSLWSNSAGLWVGGDGARNRMIVSNSGTVINATGYIGVNATSTNNLAVVTGTNSVWNNSADLIVGFLSSGNQLVVSNGGVVRNTGGYLGFNPNANNNGALVTGAGSLWTNSGSLFVGSNGVGNRLVLSNGGVVANATGYLGFNPGANSNVALVTGVGSLWNNSGAFYVGFGGSGNQLVVSNGGVVADGSGYLGDNSSSSNNVALVTGAGSLWNNSFDLNVGLDGSGNQLVVSNGGVVANNGGILGHSSAASNNLAVVTGAGSLWTNSTASSISVGFSGSGNQLVVSNGGTVAGGVAYIGENDTANNNVAVVTGAGSLWNNSSGLYVGESGSGNQLVVSNGGTVANTFGYLGNNSNASNNVAVVTGVGSLWNSSGDLYVGWDGSGNQLVVSNGGVVANTFGTVGFNSNASNNVALVTGAGSLWNNSSDLYVGWDGSGNQLIVSNGGTVRNTTGYLGFNLGASNNVAVVTGTGSLWTNSFDLTVGFSGSGNQLVVSNGGTVSATNVFVGFDSSSTNNRVTVDGGSLFATNVAGTGALDIRRGTNVLNAGLIVTDTLLLTNGALSRFEFNGGTLITLGGTVSNGQRFVVGAGGSTTAILDVRSNAPLVLANGFILGSNTAAAGNQLLITNGGTLSVTGLSFIGTNTTASNNLALVSGAGSLWTNSAGLRVGESGDGNQLVVSNGATVANTVGVVGFNAGANSNTAVVTGAGSRWLNSVELRVGRSGSSNSLLIASGGFVSNVLGIIGSQVGGNRNTVTVTGPNSSWLNSGELWVGESGVGNQLFVSSGGLVTAIGGAFVGRNAASLGNRVTVDGGSFFVTNAGGTAAFDIRRGTNVLNAGLIVADNLLLTNSAGFMEFNGGTLVVRGGTNSNGQAFVAGASGTTAAILDVRTNLPLILSNGFTLGANTAAAGNQLLITNGGTLSVNGDSYVGTNATASNNLVVVSGPGSLWTNSASLYVGYAGSGNQLVVSNGGLVANANSVYLGNFSSNNMALVTGTGSLWTNGGVLYVGLDGSGNQLVVSNGGTVASFSGSIGYTGDSNTVLVIGTNSFWTNLGSLYVGGGGGGHGSGNQLMVDNGGVVANDNGYLGYNSTSSNNLALVTGAGSLWSNRNNLSVGYFGSGNQLVVSNGGVVATANSDSYLGANPTASNNVVLVTGTGSLWSNRNNLFVGYFGSGNQLVVSNGGAVSATNVTVGLGTFATNNRLAVAGGNLIVTNTGGTGALDIRRGANVFNAGLIEADRLLLTNSAGFFEFNGGTLITRGGTVSNGQDFVVGTGAGVTNATWDVRSNTTPTTVAGNLRLGATTNDGISSLSFNGVNQYVRVSQPFIPTNGEFTIECWVNVPVTNGAYRHIVSQGPAANLPRFYLGIAPNGTIRAGDNWANTGVALPSASWHHVALTRTLSNAFVYLDGVLSATKGSALSNAFTAPFADIGQQFDNGGEFWLGRLRDLRVWSAARTQGEIQSNLNLTLSGSESSLVAYYPFNDGSGTVASNLATATGTNFNGTLVNSPVWNASLPAGLPGQLLVTNGATLAVGGALDIRNGTALFNSGVIDAGQLLMTNTSASFTFNGGTLITRGGNINNGQSFIVGASTNFGPAMWDVRSNAAPTVVVGNLTIGDFASGAQLFITNGGTLTSAAAAIGSKAGASNNSVTVGGANSTWNTSGNLLVGESGSLNNLLITNGGSVSNLYALIGSAGNNNTATVSGSNSVWNTASSMDIGASGNRLLITGGGQVRNWTTNFVDVIGNSGNNNVAVVDGSGSVWEAYGHYLGYGVGSSNGVLITNGGTVFSRVGSNIFSTLIGRVGSNNWAIVTGTNSTWTNNGVMGVGLSGSFNTLLISNGGTVINNAAYIGSNTGANSNSAIVTGPGSVWNNKNDNNSGQMAIGTSGSFNTLLLTNGGTLLSAGDVILGRDAPSTNNRLTVAGGNLIVTNTGGTAALDLRRGTNVFNGGLITADNLVMTSTNGFFEFNGGTLGLGSATVNNGQLFTVGNGTSNATLNLTASGTRTFANGLVFNTNATVIFGTGTLSSSATTNRNGQLFTVGNGSSNAVFNLLGNGTHSFANNLVIASNASLTGNGTIVGSVTNFGNIAPGNSAGSLTINGNLRLQSSSMMSFEIGGLIATNDYDQLTVTSFAELAGTLSLSILPGFLPTPTDSFTVMKFGSFSGGFANAPFLGRVSLSNNLASFAVTYSLTDLVLGGVTYADTDGDGQGDLQELAAGTDPNSSASEMQIVALLRQGEGPVTVRFTAQAGKNYRIEYSNDLVTWSQLSSPASFTAGPPGTKEWIDDGSLTGGLNFLITRRFYRVGLQ